MRVVRVSVILHQQSNLSSGTQQSRLSSQSRLECVQYIGSQTKSSNEVVAAGNRAAQTCLRYKTVAWVIAVLTQLSLQKLPLPSPPDAEAHKYTPQGMWVTCGLGLQYTA